MTTCIYWFRNDLRVADNPAFTQACKDATHLIAVYIHDPALDDSTEWGMNRLGEHRRFFLQTALHALNQELVSRNQQLIALRGNAVHVLSQLYAQTHAEKLVCEDIAAPYERAEIEMLNKQGVVVETHWQSSLLDPDALNFEIEKLPDVFTTFRHSVERAGVLPRQPIPAPVSIPPLPNISPSLLASLSSTQSASCGESCIDALSALQISHSSFPYQQTNFNGGESQALQHLNDYFSTDHALTYKQTRNQLTGISFSTKFSPWLALGSLSAPTIYARLKAFERQREANDSTYWIWFELLWRDYFRFLHLKYGQTLYCREGIGLSGAVPFKHDARRFNKWTHGQTGEPFVDAGMRELQRTGFLSNRMRQIVASYLVNELSCDWRAGAAWFESQLIDFDVYSNQGNWLYIAGRGTDPQGGRHFNITKQKRDHDPRGEYARIQLTD